MNLGCAGGVKKKVQMHAHTHTDAKAFEVRQMDGRGERESRKEQRNGMTQQSTQHRSRLLCSNAQNKQPNSTGHQLMAMATSSSVWNTEPRAGAAEPGITGAEESGINKTEENQTALRVASRRLSQASRRLSQASSKLSRASRRSTDLETATAGIKEAIESIEELLANIEEASTSIEEAATDIEDMLTSTPDTTAKQS